METEKVELNIDSALVKQGEELFADLGFSLESAVTVFIKQAVREQGLPFKPTRNFAAPVAKPAAGAEAKKTEKTAGNGNFIHIDKKSMQDLDRIR